MMTCFLLLAFIFFLQVISAFNETSKVNQIPDTELPVYKKCSCPKDKFLSQSGCVEGNYTSILIWDHETETQTLFDLKEYENVKIQELICPDDFAKAIYHDYAYFNKEGKLLISTEPETDLYCIENAIKDDEPIHIIEVCISKITVPLCCDKDQFLSANLQCIQLHSNHLPAAKAHWPDEFDYNVHHLQCDGESFDSTEIVSLNAINPLELKKMVSHFDNEYNGSYCVAIQDASSRQYFIKSCNETCVKASCIPSCCPFDQVYDIMTKRCLPHDEASKSMIQEQILGISSSYNSIPSRMNCTDTGILTFNDDSEYKFLSNNSLVVTTFSVGSTSILKPFEYCLGNLHFGNDSVMPSGLHCLYEPKEDRCAWRWIIVRVFLVISSLFILATLIVYLGVPDLRGRIQGACLISELISLLISQVNLVILQINQTEFSPNGCLAAGVIEIIFILASFFWLNVICFDVWSTFGKLRPFNENSLSKKLFAKYSLYAWGIPLLVGIIVVIVEKLEVPLRPGFELKFGQSCFFNTNNLITQWVYMYGIILILLLINCGFLIHLAIRLLPMQREQSRLFKRSGGGSKTSKNNTEHENVKLYLKLFVIMGLPWVCEIFASIPSGVDHCYLWIVDMINLFRGFFIFIIFVFKKSTRDKIIVAWCSIPREPPTPSSERSRKTSLMSLNSWLPSMRKTSKASLASGPIQMGTINETKEISEEEEEEERQK